MKMNKEKTMFTQHIFFAITIIAVGIYGILMLYFCAQTEVMVPDEIWFYNMVDSLKEYSGIDLLKTPNLLGYGSIYWITLRLLGNIFAIRLFSWICMMVTPFCIILVLRNSFGRTWKAVLIAIVLFLSCPLTWFTGKIIGPELYGNALGVLGTTIIFLKKDKKNLSWIYILGGGAYWNKHRN